MIDKPLGITSFDIIRHLKKVYQITRIGHTGTLDPLATGLVLVALGNYTKLIPYFEKDQKTYEFEVMLDGITASYDLEQPVEYISQEKQEYFKKSLKKENIQEILDQKFAGKISQIPPKFSAIKIAGKKALDKVRKGHEFEMKSREVEIFDIRILDFSYPKLKLQATVSAGTYIRSIASDLGEIIGSGGYVSVLRRTHIANLDVKDANHLEDFPNATSLDVMKLFAHKDMISLTEHNAKRMDLGLPTYYSLPKEGEYFVRNEQNITHIVKYYDGILASVRKI